MIHFARYLAFGLISLSLTYAAAVAPGPLANSLFACEHDIFFRLIGDCSQSADSTCQVVVGDNYSAYKIDAKKAHEVVLANTNFQRLTATNRLLTVSSSDPTSADDATLGEPQAGTLLVGPSHQQIALTVHPGLYPTVDGTFSCARVK